jgi:hypothetical protein
MSEVLDPRIDWAGIGRITQHLPADHALQLKLDRVKRALHDYYEHPYKKFQSPKGFTIRKTNAAR